VFSDATTQILFADDAGVFSRRLVRFPERFSHGDGACAFADGRGSGFPTLTTFAKSVKFVDDYLAGQAAQGPPDDRAPPVQRGRLCPVGKRPRVDGEWKVKVGSREVVKGIVYSSLPAISVFQGDLAIGRSGRDDFVLRFCPSGNPSGLDLLKLELDGDLLVRGKQRSSPVVTTRECLM
jgi:hypothetical protein